MRKILLDSLPSFSYYKLDINIIFAIDIFISLALVLMFNINKRNRVKFLLNLIHKKEKEEDKSVTFNFLKKDLWFKVLSQNANQHLKIFILLNFLLVLAFLFKKNLEIENLFITIILSSILFIASCAITRKKLINYREDNLKKVVKK